MTKSLTTKKHNTPNSNNNLSAHLQEALNYVNKAVPTNTRRAYKSDWQQFEEWCKVHNVSALPSSSETLAAYITELANSHKISTIERRLATISKKHKLDKLPSPYQTELVKTVWKGIKATHGTKQNRKSPILVEDLRRLVTEFKDDVCGIRDKAIILIGFVGALRRSEIVALQYEDIKLVKEGLIINLRKSKTDQEGIGAEIAIPHGNDTETCPVNALKKWLEISNIKEGSIFRPLSKSKKILLTQLTDQSVALIIKRYTSKINMNSKQYSGHSLRSGFATAAAKSGASERSIQKQTRHKDVEILRRYIREGSNFEDNAAKKLGI